MTTFTKALSRSRGVMSSAHDDAIKLKAAGMLDPQLGSMASVNPWADYRRSMTQYGLFRGWLYSAVNAIASEGAGQPVHLGKMSGGEEGKPPKKRMRGTKFYLMEGMTNFAREKAARRELEVIEEHPLYKSLEKPNHMQGRWQFVYSFIANLCLTGWSYIVASETKEGGVEFWSLPTTWIKPNKLFTEFKVINPKMPESAQDSKPLDRSQVAFAYLPNPSDPMSAMSPATSQFPAIRIDDHIQTSQEMFFENGIFPGSVVVVGKNPHPDVPGGVRPRLTAAQRRQVYGVIKKVMGGIQNYGNPAIVDGLIEKIERFSMTQNEMGWDKSEEKIRTRILSAHRVHPFILGETIVGSYAAARIVKEMFFKPVNAYLDMLGNAMSNFTSVMEGEDLLVWWERCEAVDPQLQWANLRAARSNGDISQNELRAKLGMPPDEDRNESLINPSLSQHLLKLMEMLSGGGLTPEQAQSTMEGWGLPTLLAKKLSKPPKKEETPPQLQGAPGAPGATGGKPVEGEEEGEPVSLEDVSKELRWAIGALRVTPEEVAGYITHESSR